MLTPLRQPGSVSLRRLIPSASFVGCADISVSAVTEYSRDCTPGCLFAALPGTRSHGRNFIPEALQRGAAAILTDRPLAHVSLPQCIVPDGRQAYGQVCHGLYRNPSQSLGLVGVTGTNGKTTTTWILRSLLESAARPCGVLGTIEYSDGVNAVPSSLTTPDALTLARSLAAIKQQRTHYAALELSSHALHQQRTAGMQIDVGIITNITHDHLDYHKNAAEYIAAKTRIAQLIKRGGLLILNHDDPTTAAIMDALVGEVHTLTYGLNTEADISGRILETTLDGTHFEICQGIRRMTCHTHLIGKHNIENCLAAAAAFLQLGFSIEELHTGFDYGVVVPGRLENIECGQDFNVFVDYAHTPDAIENILTATQPLTRGRTILVFGAGGERDAAKRAKMGQVAQAAEHVILTNDNPRSEDPLKIIADIRSGITSTETQVDEQPCREAAIQFALQSARPGDTVIIAGKGHETSQTIGDRTYAFNDAATCRRLLGAHDIRAPHLDQRSHVLSPQKHG